MKRLTRLSKDKTHYVTGQTSIAQDEEGYSGVAVEKLAKFENIIDDLKENQTEIQAKLDHLKSEGKTKTVTFRELLKEKMINELILARLEKS